MSVEGFEGARYLSEALQCIDGVDKDILEHPIAEFSRMVAKGVIDVHELARPFVGLELSCAVIQYRIEGVLLCTNVIETPQVSP